MPRCPLAQGRYHRLRHVSNVNSRHSGMIALAVASGRPLIVARHRGSSGGQRPCAAPSPRWRSTPGAPPSPLRADDSTAHWSALSRSGQSRRRTPSRRPGRPLARQTDGECQTAIRSPAQLPAALCGGQTRSAATAAMMADGRQDGPTTKTPMSAMGAPGQPVQRRAACVMSRRPKSHIRPVPRCASTMTSVNAATKRSTSASEMISGGMSLMTSR